MKTFFIIFLLIIISNLNGQDISVLHITWDSITKKYSYVETIKCDSSLSDTFLFYKIKDWAQGEGLNLNRLKDDKASTKEVMTGVFGTKYANFTPIDLQYRNKVLIKSEQPEIKKLILNGVYKYTSNLWSCLQTSYTNFDVYIQCKKGRARIIFTDFSIDIYNTNNATALPISGISLEDFINKEMPKRGAPCKDRISEYTIDLQDQCDKVLTDFRKYLGNLKPSISDNW